MKKFNEHTMAVFAAMNTDYEGIKNLMLDVALNREIFADGQKISKADANAKILDFSRQVLGITDIKDAKSVRRAIRDNARQWFDVIEDVIDQTMVIGLQQTDWYNQFVEDKSIAYHDRQDFYVENDSLLAVAKAGTSMHDHQIQRIGAGERFSVKTELYVIKIGEDINRYVSGMFDWSKMVDKITESYIAAIQEQVYAEISTAAAKLPVQTGFVGTGALTPATKQAFDLIVDNVAAVGNGSDTVILGTKAALSKLSGLADVQWAAADMKTSLMETGTIGMYQGSKLMVIPNRFKDRSLQAKVFPSNVLMILPATGEEGRFIKFVDEGDSEILIRENRGDYQSDIMTQEVQRRWGVATVISNQFGQWTI